MRQVIALDPPSRATSAVEMLLVFTAWFLILPALADMTVQRTRAAGNAFGRSTVDAGTGHGPACAGRARARVAAAALIAALSGAPVTPAQAQPAPSGRDIDRAVEGVYRADRYQREFPVPEAGTKPPPERPPIDSSGLSGIGSVAQMLLWGALAAFVVLLLVHLMRHRGILVGGGDGDVADTAADATGGTTGSAAMIGLLGRADELAARGDWAEAIHLLLLASVDNLKRRLGQSVPAALTSRELLGQVALPDTGRAAFADLVGAVELSHFGGKPAGPALYEACRRHYSRLWSGPGPA